MDAHRKTRGLTATNLATHHHLQCDLYLHYTYHGIQKHLGYNTHTSGAPSELAKAQFERGIGWETALYKWLDEEGLLLRLGPVVYTAADLGEMLDLDERGHFFVTGISIQPPNQAFTLTYQHYDPNIKPVTFGIAKPDLVEILRKEDGTCQWRVIDAKSSMQMKTSHHAQIYFYHLCLQHFLPKKRYIPMETLGVWLPPPVMPPVPSFDTLRTIKTSFLADTLKPYIFQQLPRILSLPQEEVRWHLNPLCRGCPFEAQDSERAVREGKFGAIPNIRLRDARLLEQLLATAEISDPTTDIEDLHRLFSDASLVDAVERKLPATFKRVRYILGIPPRRRAQGPLQSPMVETARTDKVKVIERLNYTCPRSEDIAIILTIVLNPAINGVAAFGITVFSSNEHLHIKPIVGPSTELIGALAEVLRVVIQFSADASRKIRPTTQVYTFSQAEAVALQKHIVEAALATTEGTSYQYEDIRLCIGAICEGASLLATKFTPSVLSGALLDFLSKKGARTKRELVVCAERLGLDTQGNADDVRLRIKTEIDRIKVAGGRAPLRHKSGEIDQQLGQLPRVVILKREVEQLLALPIAGFWDLSECAMAILEEDPHCPSDEDLFNFFKNNQLQHLADALVDRNKCMFDVLMSFRKRVSHLLLNGARELSAECMDLCHQNHLKKLFFMQQFEVLARLSELWQARIDGCPDAPLLTYQGTDENHEHSFILESGNVDAQRERPLYSFLLVQEGFEEVTIIPPEVHFDDLGLCGLTFPLNRYNRLSWDQQPPEVLDKLLIADVSDVGIKGTQTEVRIRTWGNYKKQLTLGRHYRLSPRLVDFNLSKVLSTLLELDLRCTANGDVEVPFLQLIANPHSFATAMRNEAWERGQRNLKDEDVIQRTLSEAYRLGVDAAGPLLLQPSQRRATRRILSHRLAVVWGPPGTGKTHTITIALLRLLQTNSRQGGKPQIIFLTAMTHAAILACSKKLNAIIKCYRNIRGYPTDWLDKVTIEHVAQGSKHRPPPQGSINSYIYTGTVYQLFNFSKQHRMDVDCVVIDEAGQLSLGLCSLVLRSLAQTGRVVVAGDSEQLAPILAAEYPQLEDRLFGSILDCIMHRSSLKVVNDHMERLLGAGKIAEHSESHASQASTVVQLEENFRLNQDLGDFIAIIYSRSFKTQKAQATHFAVQFRGLSYDEGISSRDLDASRILSRLGLEMTGAQQSSDAQQFRPISLALVTLSAESSIPVDQLGYETHVRGEANVAASFVRCLKRACPEESIFVATPHRVQRHAVREALRGLAEISNPDTTVDDLVHATEGMRLDEAEPRGDVVIDTIERLQGSEASFVVCLFSHTSASSVSDISFLLQRRRLNVAISRAKTLCILITSKEVLTPHVSVLADEENRKGYAFLRDYEKRAWGTTMPMYLDNL